MSVLRHLLMLLGLVLFAIPAAAQDFPQLTGRVVDQADLLTPEQEAELTGKLEALQGRSTRQLVVATVPSLQGYEVSDYGYRLGRHWGIGQNEANNGTILLVAKDDRKVRIEVGYGLEPILTDALSNEIIQQRILPRFRENDYPGGIVAGTDAIIEQLAAPPEQAEQRALQAQQRAQARRSSSSGGGNGSIVPLIFWGFIILFIIVPALFRRGGRGRRYRRRGGGLGSIILWSAINSAANSGRRGGGWGGGGFGGGGGWGGGGGGGGGFSGGGGSFGGGGASGSW